nr:MAG TPA: hypothetical protein [Caudoviricetes sp.]
MYFRQYSTNEDTLKEWAKQLNVVNKGNYPLYETVDKTLNHWKVLLNRNVGVNTFGISSTNESTIYNWKEKLNNIYNK